jgi:hypothetical protein
MAVHAIYLMGGDLSERTAKKIADRAPLTFAWIMFSYTHPFQIPLSQSAPQ